MPSRENLLISAEARAERREAKRRAALRFLRQHLWSTQDILQVVMGLNSRQAAHKGLVVFEEAGLIRRHTLDALGGPVTLWGITPHGQACAFHLGTEAPLPAYFEPSRISEQTARHQLDLQRLRLRAEAAGWKDWTDGNRIGDVGKEGKRPDAIVTDPLGRCTAIECERLMKTVKRYERVLAGYLRAIKAGTVARVVWVSPEPEIAARLRAIITGITAVRVGGQRVAIDPIRHHVNLYFTDYEEWPNI
jgi:hypothetical protein